MSSPAGCPTPLKARFATAEAAESAARRAALGVGTHLSPYRCQDACGWFHLTSKPRKPEPEVTLADIAALHQLDDDAFRELVGNDARGGASRLRAKALRDPSLAARWIRTVKVIQRDLSAQFRLRQGDYDQDTRVWRAGAEAFRVALSQRRAEAAEISRANPVGVDTGGRRRTEAEDRDMAGELAVNRLIKAHQAEWTELLAEEYARLGVALPARIQRYLDAHRSEQEAS